MGVHGIELAVVDVELVQGRSVEIEKAKLLGRLTSATTNEQGIDLESEECGEGVSLRWSLARLVVGDDQATVVVAIDAVEDPPDGDPFEVLEHVQLPVHGVEPGRVLDAEVVGQKSEGLNPPFPLFGGIAEQVHELLGPAELGPGVPEQVIEQLG